MSHVAVNSGPQIRREESAVSAVSWAAILAGAFVASAFSLVLLTLGAGLGLVSVSPWSNSGVSAATFGVLAGAWLIAVQLFSSGLGGYIAGRLRTRWVDVHTDEVFFRDTAHGFLVWAVGAVLSAGILASAAASMASGAAQTGAAVAQGAGSAVSAAAGPAAGKAASDLADPTNYFTDMLFRSDRAGPAEGDTAASHAEVARILAKGLADGDLSESDKTYLARMVATRTGLSQADAEKRVSDVVTQAKTAAASAADTARKAADAARKVGVYASLWAFISLLIGAFSASYMATIGGRIRDEQPPLG